jgi:hypothetical protein
LFNCSGAHLVTLSQWLQLSFHVMHVSVLISYPVTIYFFIFMEHFGSALLCVSWRVYRRPVPVGGYVTFNCFLFQPNKCHPSVAGGKMAVSLQDARIWQGSHYSHHSFTLQHQSTTSHHMCRQHDTLGDGSFHTVSNKTESSVSHTIINFYVFHFRSMGSEWILGKLVWGGGVLIGFDWLRIGTGGGLLWVRWWTFGFLRHRVS